MEIFDRAVLLFTVLADVYMVYDFFDNSFDLKDVFKGRSKYLVLISFVLANFSVNLVENTYLNLVFTLMVCFLLSLVLFVVPIRISIVYAIIAWSILIFGEFLFSMILAIPVYLLKVSAVTNLADVTWVVISVKLISYIVFVIVKQVSGKGKYHMPKKIFFMYICQPIVSMVIMIVTYYSNANTVITDGFRIGMTISFALLLMANVLMFYAFNQYALQMNINMEQQIKLMKQTADEEYYAQVAEMNENHRRFIHDANNHFKTIRELAFTGDIEKIIKIADECAGEIRRSSAKIYCKHSVVNAILNEKVRIAEEKGIHFDISVDVNGNIMNSISDGDIVCILGNLLDNALLAAAGCEAYKSYISLRMFMKHEGKVLVVIIKNSYNEPLVRVGDGFLTTKREKGVHGIGLKNVRQAVEKYTGFFECDAEQGEFTALAELRVNI